MTESVYLNLSKLDTRTLDAELDWIEQGGARLLMWLAKGDADEPKSTDDLPRALGLPSATVNGLLARGVTFGLVALDGDEWTVTPRGHDMARMILYAFVWDDIEVADREALP